MREAPADTFNGSRGVTFDVFQNGDRVVVDFPWTQTAVVGNISVHVQQSQFDFCAKAAVTWQSKGSYMLNASI
jgi:hypothetical protein